MTAFLTDTDWRNPGEALPDIEVESGSYLGTNDIVKLEDTVGLAPLSRARSAAHFPVTAASGCLRIRGRSRTTINRASTQQAPTMMPMPTIVTGNV